MAWYDGVVGGILNAGINVWNTKKQIEQNEITRQREDNAIQRRRKDLEKAGLNPNLAAGSAASASNMTAPQLDNSAIGDYLDYKARKEQIRRTEEETEIAKLQKDYWNYQNMEMRTNVALNSINTLLSLGYSPDDFEFKFIKGKGLDVKFNNHNYTSINGSQLMNQFNLQNDYLYLDKQNLYNNAFMLQVDKNWYKANKWINAIGDVSDIGINVAKPFIPRINRNFGEYSSTYNGRTENYNYNYNYNSRR